MLLHSKSFTVAWILCLLSCTRHSQHTPSPVLMTVASASSTPNAIASNSSFIQEESSTSIAQVDPKEGVAIVAGPSGYLGAWLALGPFQLRDSSEHALEQFRLTSFKGEPIDDHALKPRFGELVSTYAGQVRQTKQEGKRWSPVKAEWRVVSSGDGPIDLEKTFHVLEQPAIAYLGAELRVPNDSKLILMLGADDGCEVIVDGQRRLLRDEARPQRDNDDLIPLQLARGNHTIILKLRQRDGAWAIRVRLVDSTWQPPVGARLLLPNAPASLSQELAQSMSWVRIMRDVDNDGYKLRTWVQYPEGAPVGVPLTVSAGLFDSGVEKVPIRDVGTLAIGPRSVGDRTADIALAKPYENTSPIKRHSIPITSIAEHEQQARDLTVRVQIAGRIVEKPFRPREPIRRAITRARSILAQWQALQRPQSIPNDVNATLEYLLDRLAHFVTRGDADIEAQLKDAEQLNAFVDDVEAKRDPIATRSGVMRLAHVARADGKPQPFALYVPSKLSNDAKVPLYVGLHGMNGGPLAMMRVFFGGDDSKKTMFELDRSMSEPAPFNGIVLAPHAHGNAMYRQLGEQEVLDMIEWAKARFPQIDSDRVYVTGFSMGGIGAASIALHYPDLFAASQPLCGYHSYAIRRDVAPRPKRSWEKFLIEDRSNSMWAENGFRLPLHIVHGTYDWPETNSQVLIDAYENLGFPVQHDHPKVGHDVWGWAYDNLNHVRWFNSKQLDRHPRRVRFRTTRTRYRDSAWVHVDALTHTNEWASIDAHVMNRSQINIKLKGIEAFHLDRDAKLMSDKDIRVVVHEEARSTTFRFEPAIPIALHKESNAWVAGPLVSTERPRKQGSITGPIRDVFHEPLVFVYGTEDPTQTVANFEVAQQMATIRSGVDVHYPILKDVEINVTSAPTQSMILIGNARSNRVTRALEPRLPIRILNPDENNVRGGAIAFAGKTFEGSQLGAAFIVPHPLAPKHYLVVIEGVTALGTWRSLSLPDLLSDFVIYDQRVASARGQVLLSSGAVLAAGFFDEYWQPPTRFDDPFLSQVKPLARNEYDATAYLP